MSQERELFIIRRASADTQYDEHPFYRWLVANENRLDTRDAWILDDYLKSLGYDKERHRITGDDVDYLRDVHRAYGQMWVPCREPQRLDELFRLSSADPLPGDQGDLYWIRHPDHRHQYGRLTDRLKDLIEPLAVVYQISPAHYYFEVAGGYLLIKYQHIIGSRRLCPVKERDE